VYTGEWKEDKRAGFGVAERSDGLKYEGEWHNNMKNGYGVTTFPDGTREEGKYKNNVLQNTGRRLLVLRSTKIRERVDAAVAASARSAQIALQKADIANSRMESARCKAELADEAVQQAKQDSDLAQAQALNVQRAEQQQQQQRLQMHQGSSVMNPKLQNRRPSEPFIEQQGVHMANHVPLNQAQRSYPVLRGGQIPLITEDGTHRDPRWPSNTSLDGPQKNIGGQFNGGMHLPRDYSMTNNTPRTAETT